MDEPRGTAVARGGKGGEGEEEEEIVADGRVTGRHKMAFVSIKTSSAEYAYVRYMHTHARAHKRRGEGGGGEREGGGRRWKKAKEESKR